MEVTSEILPFFETDRESKPRISDRNVVSKFVFSCPDESDGGTSEECHLEKDDDGDYVVRRKGGNDSVKDVVITLEHGVSTELKLVGLQIWRGALLLADFVIHRRCDVRGATVLELGAGVGLTSIVAGMFAKRIICTDVDRGDILRLLEHNVERNRGVMRAEVAVRGLDFFQKEWQGDVGDKMREVTVILAADVIYDNDVTAAFVDAIAKMLSTPPRKTLYLAMERRYVFTLADLDSVAPCYEYLLTCLDEAKRSEPFSRCKVEEIALDFPQYFNYDRVKELIMFKISS